MKLFESIFFLIPAEVFHGVIVASHFVHLLYFMASLGFIHNISQLT